MGLLGGLFKKSEGGLFELLNDNIFQIEKGVNEYSLNIYKDGRCVKTVHINDVLISSDVLESTWFYCLHKDDTIPSMSDATVSESDGVYYIRCDAWMPAPAMQFPSRIKQEGKLQEWYLRNAQLWVRMSSDNQKWLFMTSNGECRYLLESQVIWSGNVPEDKYSWYICEVETVSMNMFNAHAICKAPNDTEIIINGLMHWDESKAKFI